MSTRRAALAGEHINSAVCSHAGLWLDKYIPSQSKEEKGARAAFVRDVTSIPESEDYAPFLARWRSCLESLRARAEEARVRGRMIVGLGAEGVLEVSIALHRTYSVPYVPGAALKGLAASFARRYCGDGWEKGGRYYRAVFGGGDDAGYVTFHDALYVPGTGHRGKALWPDVLTPHHPDYNQGGLGATPPPADWDTPDIVPMLSATGAYLIAVSAPHGCEPWRDRAFEVLAYALGTEGVGAKTSSGYGRLLVEGFETPAGGAAPAPVEDAGARRADDLIGRVRALRDNEVAGRIANFVGEWRALEAGEEHRRRVAEEILGRVTEAGREKASREKGWYRELLEYLGRA